MKKIRRRLKFKMNNIDDYFTQQYIGHGFLFDSSTLMSLIDRNDVMSKISSIENIGEYEKIILQFIIQMRHKCYQIDDFISPII